MNQTRIRDLLLSLWYCLLKLLTFENDDQTRCESARLTHNRLKAIDKMNHAPQVLEALTSGQAPDEICANRVPLCHEFKEVLGVEPVIAVHEGEQAPISHISQYRLAVYVASLSETQRVRAQEAINEQCA
jgi:hypothetical protein